MIATRFRSVYWVGGVAVAALGCYLVSQRVAAERASLDRVEAEIVSGERQIRALETEIGTRAGLNQIERWNAEVLSLSAPRAGQFVANEVQLAGLVRPKAPAMAAPAPVTLVSSGAPPVAPAEVTRTSYEAPPRVVAPAVVRASYTAPPRAERKADPDRTAGPDRTPDRAAKAERATKPERVAKADAAPQRDAARKPAAKDRPERSARHDAKAKPERVAKRDTAERKAEDRTPRARPAIYVKPKASHQSMALLDDKLLGDLGRLAASERSGAKRNR